MTKNMWMVRAGESAYLIDDFKKKKLLAGLSPEDLKLLGIERKD